MSSRGGAAAAGGARGGGRGGFRGRGRGRGGSKFAHIPGADRDAFDPNNKPKATELYPDVALEAPTGPSEDEELLFEIGNVFLQQVQESPYYLKVADRADKKSAEPTVLRYSELQKKKGAGEDDVVDPRQQLTALGLDLSFFPDELAIAIDPTRTVRRKVVKRKLDFSRLADEAAVSGDEDDEEKNDEDEEVEEDDNYDDVEDDGDYNAEQYFDADENDAGDDGGDGANPRDPAAPASAAMSTPDLFAAMAEADKAEGMRNPRYRKYIQALEKVLVSFDTIAEWPDIITFLSRLGKTIQAHAEFPVIPGKLVISKRLAQCLNPALPAGVHQKALETYVIVFETIGPGNLARDSAFWTFGLFPYFANAPMSVKPLLLSLVEIHFLPLRLQLHPILRSLVMALLPGLEEEDNEHFEGHLLLLDRLQKQVDADFFFQTMWSIVASSPLVRRTALLYLNKRLAMVRGVPAQVSRAICGCFVDKNILVQRSALDLIVTRYPLHRAAAEFAETDLVFMMAEALKVVLRRDMSLNRRLYSWILGDEEHYFQSVARPLLSSCFRRGFASSDPSVIVRNIKILISLLDKDEVGRGITEDVIAHVLDACWTHARVASTASAAAAAASEDELKATVTMFFDMLDPVVVWRELNLRLERTGLDALDFVAFATRWLELADDDVPKLHLPLTVIHLLGLVHASEPAQRSAAAKVLAFVSEIIASTNLRRDGEEEAAPGAGEGAAAPAPLAAITLASVRTFFQTSGTAELTDWVPLAAVLRPLEDLLLHLSQRGSDPADVPLVATCVALLLSLKSPPHDAPRLLARIHDVADIELMVPLVRFALQLPRDVIAPHHTALIRELLASLRTGAPNAATDAEAVELIWVLVDTFPSSLASLVAAVHAGLRSEPGFHAFGVLWKHSQARPRVGRVFSEPLLAVLTAYGGPSRALWRVADRWIARYLLSYTHLLDPLVLILADPLVERRAVAHPMGGGAEYYEYARPVDFALVEFAFHQLGVLGEIAGSQLPKALRHPMPSPATTTYFQYLLDAAITYLASFTAPGTNATLVEANEGVQTAACDFLVHLLQTPGHATAALHARVRQTLAVVLHVCQSRQSLELQVKVLHPLRLALAGVPVPTSGLRRGTVLGSNLALSSVENEGSTRHLAVDTASAQPAPLGGAMAELVDAVLVGALTQATNRPVLASYVDFIVDATHHLTDLLPALLNVLVQSLVAAAARNRDENTIVAYLRGVQHLYSLALGQAMPPVLSAIDGPGDAASVASESASGLSQISQYMTGVFSPNSGNNAAAAAASARTTHWLFKHAVQTFPQLVDLLVATHARLAAHAADSSTRGQPPSAARVHVLRATKRRLDRLVEYVALACPNAWVDAVLLDRALNGRSLDASLVACHMETEDFQAAAMTNVLRRLTPGAPEVLLPELGEDQALATIVDIARSGDTMYVSTWPQVQLFVRDYLTLHHGWVGPPILELVILYTGHIVDLHHQQALGDRRMAKEALDLFMRALDSLNTTLVGYVFQSQQPPQQQQSPEAGVTASPMRKSGSRARLSAGSVKALPGGSAADALLRATHEMVVPAVRRIVRDQDRASAVYSNMVHYLVQPSLKQPAHPTYRAVLRVMEEIALIPFAARAWKRELWDHFLDHRFFPLPVVAFEPWAHLMTRYSHETDRFVEVVNRIAPAASTALFGSREVELFTRCQLLRRISFLLWSCDVDRHVPSLPVLQEKVIDLLTLQNGDMVAEVFLLARVMVLRFSPAHMVNLWPILVSEMMRIVDSAASAAVAAAAAAGEVNGPSPVLGSSSSVSPAPSHGSDAGGSGGGLKRDDLLATLAVGKFLDLLLTLQLPEFQIYQPVFAGEGAAPGLLHALLGSPPMGLGGGGRALGSQSSLRDASGRAKPPPTRRRPSLHLGTLPSLADLAPFIHEYSALARQVDYGLADVDGAAVEAVMMQDLIAGIPRK
ncbi:hypothetical protein H9P43_005686 [Blastocladiella emersonii ATCC 22665]|nr:hypothetical protein H9P43_005686 [Blastocladiella emersonii ATCC 22665]